MLRRLFLGVLSLLFNHNCNVTTSLYSASHGGSASMYVHKAKLTWEKGYGVSHNRRELAVLSAARQRLFVFFSLLVYAWLSLASHMYSRCTSQSCSRLMAGNIHQCQDKIILHRTWYMVYGLCSLLRHSLYIPHRFLSLLSSSSAFLSPVA